MTHQAPVGVRDSPLRFRPREYEHDLGVAELGKVVHSVGVKPVSARDATRAP